MSPPDPIARRKLSDEVFDRLRRMITSGDVQPGDVMPSERELMERFGVGRPAIREAMQALSSRGLLSISHGERARVRQLTARAVVQQVDSAALMMLAGSPDSLAHLKSVRRFFERGMVREAAEKATEADVERLTALLAAQRAALGDRMRFVAIDIQFHGAIAAISGNPIFEAVSGAMLDWLKAYRSEMLIWSGKETLTLSEHDAILRTVAAHDPDAADAAMVAHLDRSSDIYVHRTGQEQT